MTRKIVEDILTSHMTRAVWTGNYPPVLPISPQDFELTAVLPAVFYMFRRGHRRGRGQFLEVYGTPEDGEATDECAELNQSKPKKRDLQRRAATIERVAGRLAEQAWFSGFNDELGQALLGDLLLAFCLENRKHALGRNEQIQRVAPTHYLASWVDLPASVVNLRFLPETLVALLADQKKGEFVDRTTDKTRFAVGRDFTDNALLKIFRQGMDSSGEIRADDPAYDRFREDSDVGIDQLLMVRLAQSLKRSPEKLRGEGGEHISNQRPIARRASRFFTEDLRNFVPRYGAGIPRQTLVPMLESCSSIGLFSILTSAMEIVFEWARTGAVPKCNDQRPAPFFVDCSCSVDHPLRHVAEQSFQDFLRRLDRFPVALMCLRLLDYKVRHDKKIQVKQPWPWIPHADEWLDRLGEILHERHPRSERILDDLAEKAATLRDELRKEGSAESAQVAELLDNSGLHPNPAWRLAEALSILMGTKNLQENLIKHVDSCLMIERPNGIAAKRRIRRVDPFTGRKTTEARSLILTDPALDYLVHLHLLSPGRGSSRRGLSFRDFLGILRGRYGMYIDQTPPGMTISNDLLQANRAVLERRLRDLGLLVGVNDAEAMKRLEPRFQPEAGEFDETA